MSDKFEYKYSAPTKDERKEIESIRSQYMPKTDRENKLELLRKLDFKVKNIPMILAMTFGIVGALIFGTGMTFFLEWGNLWFCGIPLCLIGIVPIVAAYPIYCKYLKKLKDKYRDQIIELTEELM